jgi:hypothetical protein
MGKYPGTSMMTGKGGCFSNPQNNNKVYKERRKT